MKNFAKMMIGLVISVFASQAIAQEVAPEEKKEAPAEVTAPEKGKVEKEMKKETKETKETKEKKK